MFGLGVAGEGEGALQVDVEVDGPGHDALVAREDAGAAGGDEQAVGRGDGAGSAGRWRTAGGR